MTKDSKNQLGVYSIVSDESGHELWVEVGYATRHNDGEGFDLTLRALPLASRLVLRKAATDGRKAELRAVSQPSDQDDWQEEPGDLAALSLASQVRDFERAVIRQCLLETGGNIGAVLERLKIPRRTLNEKMVRLGIDRRRLKASHRPGIPAKAETANPGSEHVVHGEPPLFLDHPEWGKNGAG
jgi:hypothetical protein